MLASSYPFLDIFWSMVIFFGFVIWIYLLILVLSDNFRGGITAGGRRQRGRCS